MDLQAQLSERRKNAQKQRKYKDGLKTKLDRIELKLDTLLTSVCSSERPSETEREREKRA